MDGELEQDHYDQSTVLYLYNLISIEFILNCHKIPTLILNIESAFLNSDTYSWFHDLHSSVEAKDKKISSPRHFIKLINSFRSIFNKKRGKIIERQKHLKVIVTFWS